MYIINILLYSLLFVLGNKLGLKSEMYRVFIAHILKGSQNKYHHCNNPRAIISNSKLAK